MKAANSYATPWGLDTTDGLSVADSGGYTTYRTPYTYLHCIAMGDTLVFLNGTVWPYYDGYGDHSSLTTTGGAGCSDTAFYTLMARPGASVLLGSVSNDGGGSTGYSYKGFVDGCRHSVVSGLGLAGNHVSGLSVMSVEGDGSLWARLVGNTLQCPDCDGSAGALNLGDYTNAYDFVLGNMITNISTTSGGGVGSDKEFHDVYVSGSNFDFGWNRIYNAKAYNGIQVHHDGDSGFFNFSIHDNDIADVNGSCINLSLVDPSSGYVQAYNNILHHCGMNLANDGENDDPHGCIAVKGGVSSSTGVGTVYLWNNTMFDCNSVLNISEASSGEWGSCAVYLPPVQTSVTKNLVNNVLYQPAYTYTSVYNAYICTGTSSTTTGTLSGSNNIWYSATTPGSTANATTIGTIENPLYVTAADGAWTNYELQATSPAIGAGTRVGPVES
jgi:hypothetical protein